MLGTTAVPPGATTIQVEQETMQRLLQIPPQQLQQMIKSGETQLRDITSQFRLMEQAKERFKLSQKAVESMRDLEPGGEVLVPLTSQLYIPGKLLDPSSIVVDIGTNYYVKRDIDGTKEVLRRKLTQIAEIQQRLLTSQQQVQQNLVVLNAVFRHQLQAIQEAQERQRQAGPPQGMPAGVGRGAIPGVGANLRFGQ